MLVHSLHKAVRDLKSGDGKSSPQEIVDERQDGREKILPAAGQRNVLITSALPFVNNVPHLGNTPGSVLSGDVFARSCRKRGINTLYVSGTDEYGTTAEARAFLGNGSPENFESTKAGSWSTNSKVITASWLKEGLQPRSITRDIKWGTQRTGANGGADLKIFSSISLSEKTTLFSLNYPTYEGGKFSKSRNIGVFGDSARDTGVPFDVWCYFLLSHRPENGGTEFTWNSFVSCNNNLLLKNVGNLVSRMAKFIASRHYDHVVPDWTKYHEPASGTFREEVNQLLQQYIQELDAVEIRAASSMILQMSWLGNAFLQYNRLD
ncbi:methionyl-tRNA synthetase [Moelleriella libera RCEF 2490]|uniref:methionine--tRNA ligase n=1 Tax=Moelleriella libera RCEF 2490 TaxID=1081109 RepID=A0A166UEQ0_9HYPO|nr:methionyl-tRNA synthetase [Moelleriella libera RCEF 2490]